MEYRGIEGVIDEMYRPLINHYNKLHIYSQYIYSTTIQPVAFH